MKEWKLGLLRKMWDELGSGVSVIVGEVERLVELEKLRGGM